MKSNKRRLRNCGEVIEIHDTGTPGVVQMRYVSPYPSGWVKEHYRLDDLSEQGWVADENGGEE